jgi:hypothetical protein
MVRYLDKLNHVNMRKYLIEYINQYIDHIVENNNYMNEQVDRNKNISIEKISIVM